VAAAVEMLRAIAEPEDVDNELGVPNIITMDAPTAADTAAFVQHVFQAVNAPNIERDVFDSFHTIYNRALTKAGGKAVESRIASHWDVAHRCDMCKQTTVAKRCPTFVVISSNRSIERHGFRKHRCSRCNVYLPHVSAKVTLTPEFLVTRRLGFDGDNFAVGAVDFAGARYQPRVVVLYGNIDGRRHYRTVRWDTPGQRPGQLIDDGTVVQLPDAHTYVNQHAGGYCVYAMVLQRVAAPARAVPARAAGAPADAARARHANRTVAAAPVVVAPVVAAFPVAAAIPAVAPVPAATPARLKQTRVTSPVPRDVAAPSASTAIASVFRPSHGVRRPRPNGIVVHFSP
jgi:hypothetical protein